MVLIFGLSSSSGLPATPVPDKAIHFIEYAGLGVLLVRALGGEGWARPTAGLAVMASALAALYGLTDEIHQLAVAGRRFEWLDLVADAAGGAAGAGALYAWGIIAARFPSRVARS